MVKQGLLVASHSVLFLCTSMYLGTGWMEGGFSLRRTIRSARTRGQARH
jgi:hypothetical protein